MLRVFASNFRGFKSIDFDLTPVTFVVGDNSSGKTSLLYLVEILLSEKFANDFEVFNITPSVSDAGDIFSPYIRSKVTQLGYVLSSDGLRGENPDARFLEFRGYPSGHFRLEGISIATSRNLLSLARSGKQIRKSIIPFRGLSSRRFDFFSRAKKQSGKGRIVKGTDADIIEHWRFASIEVDRKNRNISVPFFQLSTLKFIHYGPLRTAPLRYYFGKYKDFDSSGMHVPFILKSMYESRNKLSKIAIARINKFGRQSGLFDRVSVRPYSRRTSRSPFAIDVVRNGKILNIADIGFGNAQILPVVIDAIRSVGGRNHTILSVEQPETHLHPRAQAAFGELIFDLAREGVHFLVETHSDFIIDRFRFCQRTRGKRSSIQGSILFCESTTQGNVAHRIEMSKEGKVNGAPVSYRQFFLSEQERLFEAL
jgi:hypothetical protein